MVRIRRNRNAQTAKQKTANSRSQKTQMTPKAAAAIIRQSQSMIKDIDRFERLKTHDSIFIRQTVEGPEESAPEEAETSPEKTE